MRKKFEKWANNIKLLGKPAFDLGTWDGEDYDDFMTALAFAAWKAATQPAVQADTDKCVCMFGSQKCGKFDGENCTA